MRIAEILSQKGADVHMIAPDATLRDAIRRLVSERIGALVVSRDDEHIDGILSERDVIRVQADDAVDIDSMQVREAMTAEVISVEPTTTIDTARELMNSSKIRHLPVLDGDRLVGMLSIRDVIGARVRELEAEREQMENYVSGEFGVSSRLST